MPRLIPTILAALVFVPGCLQAKTSIFDQNSWEVVYDPDAAPLRAACVVKTYQPRGIFELTMFDDQLDLSFILLSNHTMQRETNSPFRIQVDEFPVLDLHGERYTLMVHTDDIDIQLIDQIARGKVLKVDVNADDRWDVKIPLEHAFPALKSLATGYKDL